MDKVLPALLIVVVVAAVLVSLALAWRSRARRQSGLGALEVPPGELGDVQLREDLLYVATTSADTPLDRIVAGGLGFRGRAVLTVAATGVVLDLAGVDPIFIPRRNLRGAGRATWTIDRVVPGDGLVFVRWSLGAADVDTYLRSADSTALLGALDIPQAAAPDTPSRSDS